MLALLTIAFLTFNKVQHNGGKLYVDNLSFNNLVSSVSTYYSKTTSLKFYPNPASDNVTFEIDNTNNSNLILNIYNIIGTLVKSETIKQNNRQINIGDLTKGVYMVTVKSKGITETQKLIIQR
jgi:hypothetical protein